MPLPLPLRSRRVGAAVGVVVVLVLLLLSHGFGRAEPTNNYRPLLTTDPLATGCYPLPDGVRLDGLAYQVRWDEDVDTANGERRALHGQYDLVERDEAEQLLVTAFTRAGFAATEPQAGSDVVLRRGAEQVGITVTELPDTSAETLVRGEFVLDLPVVERARDDEVCKHRPSTKRWGESQ